MLLNIEINILRQDMKKLYKSHSTERQNPTILEPFLRQNEKEEEIKTIEKHIFQSKDDENLFLSHSLVGEENERQCREEKNSWKDRFKGVLKDWCERVENFMNSYQFILPGSQYMFMYVH